MDNDRSGLALSRRAFVRVAGGGLLVSGVALLEACAPAAAPAPASAPAATVPPTDIERPIVLRCLVEHVIAEEPHGGGKVPRPHASGDLRPLHAIERAQKLVLGDGVFLGDAVDKREHLFLRDPRSRPRFKSRPVIVRHLRVHAPRRPAALRVRLHHLLAAGDGRIDDRHHTDHDYVHLPATLLHRRHRSFRCKGVVSQLC